MYSHQRSCLFTIDLRISQELIRLPIYETDNQLDVLTRLDKKYPLKQTSRNKIWEKLYEYFKKVLAKEKISSQAKLKIEYFVRKEQGSNVKHYLPNKTGNVLIEYSSTDDTPFKMLYDSLFLKPYDHRNDREINTTTYDRFRSFTSTPLVKPYVYTSHNSRKKYYASENKYEAAESKYIPARNHESIEYKYIPYRSYYSMEAKYDNKETYTTNLCKYNEIDRQIRSQRIHYSLEKIKRRTDSYLKMVDKQISLDPSSTRERQPLVDLQQKTLPSRQRDLTHDYKGKDYPTTGSIRNNFLFDRTKQMPMLQYSSRKYDGYSRRVYPLGNQYYIPRKISYKQGLTSVETQQMLYAYPRKYSYVIDE